MDKDGLAPLLDLDRGEVIPDPGDMAAAQALLAQPGVIIRHDDRVHQIVLLGMNGSVLAPAGGKMGDPWDQFTDRKGLDSLGPNGAPAGAMLGTNSPDDLPKTFLFKTAAGARGLLQVESFGDSPPTVKIRFKLVVVPSGTGGAPR
jgi:hypothetical protein